MIIVCVLGCYSDTSIDLVEHPDASEALAVLAMLKPFDGPCPVCSAETWTLHDDGHAPEPLSQVVGGYLLESYGAKATARTALYDALPIGVLRSAVDYMAGYHEKSAAGYRSKDQAVMARTIREALFLREQKDRIAADLAEMERIGAMAVEE